MDEEEQIKSPDQNKPKVSSSWLQMGNIVTGLLVGIILGVGAAYYKMGATIDVLKEQVGQLKSQSLASNSSLLKDQSGDKIKSNADKLSVAAESEQTLELMQASSTWGRSIPGSSGRVVYYTNPTDEGTFSGKAELKGLSPNHGYMLTLNGIPGDPSNNQLPHRKGEEKMFDFLEVITDPAGNVTKEFKSRLPVGEYIVKFFVKDTADWKPVLYNDLFRFKVK